MTPTKANTGFETLWAEASEKATEAWIGAEPTPILVYTPKGLFDDTPDTEKPMYVHSEGLCGFAWLVVKDGRTSFARWLAKNDIGSQSAYYGGRIIHPSDMVNADRKSQSHERKCQAMFVAAKVFRDAGINVEVIERLD